MWQHDSTTVRKMADRLVFFVSSTCATIMVAFQEDRKSRKMQLERQMVGMPEDKKLVLRRSLEQEEMLAQKESRKKKLNGGGTC